MQQWALQFPDRKPTHFVFPSEKGRDLRNDEIPAVFDADPTKAISSWKTAWASAKTAAAITCRFQTCGTPPSPGSSSAARVRRRGRPHGMERRDRRAHGEAVRAPRPVSQAKRNGRAGRGAACTATDGDGRADARHRPDDPSMTAIRWGHKNGHSRIPGSPHWTISLVDPRSRVNRL